MNFPVVDIPWLGPRYLIALVAVLHVLINHACAIGGSLVVVMLERKGWRDGDQRYEALARRVAATFFVLTTSVGAMTGVGIWFTTMVLQPEAIGSMLRIFFAAWFVEWLVFVAEVGLVLVYYLGWDRLTKPQHLRLGWIYVGASAATMAIITGILGFMLSPGAWSGQRGFWSAFFNPTYLPQLLLRTGLALGLAAGLTMVLTRWLAPKDFQREASAYLSRFLLAATPLMALGGAWYWAVLPASARALVPTALVSTVFLPYVSVSYWTNTVVCLLVGGLGAWGLRRGLGLPARLVSLAVVVVLLCQFERVREFVRKPYMIPGYLYANGLRVADKPVYDRDGILAHARYVRGLPPGQAVFKLECAACHQLGGANDPTARLTGVSTEGIDGFINVLHEAHPFMPPFMGTPAERKALAEFLAYSRSRREKTETNAIITPSRATLNIAPSLKRGRGT